MNMKAAKSAPNVGLEPTTPGLRVPCSTDWANRADMLAKGCKYIINLDWDNVGEKKSEAPPRFELGISCLLDRRFNQLSHGAKLLRNSWEKIASLGVTFLTHTECHQGETRWLVGLGVWFSLRVREVPGSNPGRALLQLCLLSLHIHVGKKKGKESNAMEGMGCKNQRRGWDSNPRVQSTLD